MLPSNLAPATEFMAAVHVCQSSGDAPKMCHTRGILEEEVAEMKYWAYSVSASEIWPPRFHPMRTSPQPQRVDSIPR